jgi:hypothetical protein
MRFGPARYCPTQRMCSERLQLSLIPGKSAYQLIWEFFHVVILGLSVKECAVCNRLPYPALC